MIIHSQELHKNLKKKWRLDTKSILGGHTVPRTLEPPQLFASRAGEVYPLVSPTSASIPKSVCRST